MGYFLRRIIVLLSANDAEIFSKIKDFMRLEFFGGPICGLVHSPKHKSISKYFAAKCKDSIVGLPQEPDHEHYFLINRVNEGNHIKHQYCYKRNDGSIETDLFIVKE